MGVTPTEENLHTGQIGKILSRRLRVQPHLSHLHTMRDASVCDHATAYPPPVPRRYTVSPRRDTQKGATSAPACAPRTRRVLQGDRSDGRPARRNFLDSVRAHELSTAFAQGIYTVPSSASSATGRKVSGASGAERLASLLIASYLPLLPPARRYTRNLTAPRAVSQERLIRIWESFVTAPFHRPLPRQQDQTCRLTAEAAPRDDHEGAKGSREKKTSVKREKIPVTFFGSNITLKDALPFPQPYPLPAQKIDHKGGG